MAGSVTPTRPTPAAAAAPAAATAAPARKKPRRNASFADDVRWQPSGPTLALRKDSVGGPFGFLNPTTALYDIRSNDEPGGGRADLADLTDAERQERAKVRWNARDYRKGKLLFLVSPCLAYTLSVS